MKLISAEGFAFIVDYECACVSQTIKNMLTSQGTCGFVCCCPAWRLAACSGLYVGGKPEGVPSAVLPPAAATAAASHGHCCPHHPPTASGAPAANFIESESGEVRFPGISTPVLEVVCKYFHYKVSQR